MQGYLSWSDQRIGIWGSNQFTWDEVVIAEELKAQYKGAGPHEIYTGLNKASKEEKKKIISIIAKLEGKEYKLSKEKRLKNPKITIKDVEILIDKLNIEVNV